MTASFRIGQGDRGLLLSELHGPRGATFFIATNVFGTVSRKPTGCVIAS